MLDALPFAAWPLGAQAGLYGFAGGLAVLMLTHLVVFSRQRIREKRAQAEGTVPGGGQNRWRSVFPSALPPRKLEREGGVRPGQYARHFIENRPLRRFDGPGKSKRRSLPVPRRWAVPPYRH